MPRWRPHSGGCGAACLSMAIRYLTGDEAQTPETLFRAAYDRGDYFGDGLSHAALDRLGEDYGVAVKAEGKADVTLTCWEIA